MTEKQVFTREDVQLRPKSSGQVTYCICCTHRLAAWEAVCSPAYIGYCGRERCQDYAVEQAIAIANLVEEYKEEQGIERIGHVLVLTPSRPSFFSLLATGQSMILVLMRKMGDLAKRSMQ